MKKFSNKILFLILMIAAAFTFIPRDVEAQQFLRNDSLRFSDSSCYYETTPYGPIWVDATDSAANARVDTIKGYYVNWHGDTVIAPWYNSKTGNIDTILVCGNGRSNSWKCNIDNPKGIKLVRTNDSSTVTMKQTKVTIRGTARLYNSIFRKSDPYLTAASWGSFYLRNPNYKQAKQGYSVRSYMPDKILISDKLRLLGKMRW